MPRRGWSWSGLGVLLLASTFCSAPGVAAIDPATMTEERERQIVAAVEGRPRHAPRPDDRISILVEMEPGSHRDQVRDFARTGGGTCKYEYTLLPNWMNLRGIARGDLAALRAEPGVRRVVEDMPVHAALNDSTQHVRALQSQVQAAGVGVDGTGVRLCVLDTGIDSNHTMYASRIDAAAGYDFINDDPDPEDDNGHGSHVAGIALGRTGFEQDLGGGSGLEPLQGVAPAATLIGVKVLGSGGGGLTSQVIAGIEHCSDPSLPGGPADVINMSLGGGGFSGPCDDDPLGEASNAASDAGVVVVAAAGNGARSNTLLTPACGPKVIAVAATYDDDFPNPDFPDRTSFAFSICTDTTPRRDDLTCFSDRSTQIDVAAPGCYTFSSDFAEASGDAITAKCGTSMASPHVAGLAALVLNRDPSLTPAEVRDLLEESAVDLGPPGFDTGFGHGRIDAVSALKLASSCSIPEDCDDGRFCNGFETCLDGRCTAGAAPCPGQACDEGGQVCVPCASDTDCDDGVLCNGAEVCSAGFCEIGPDPCVVDTCNPATNTCVECFTDADCDDGDFCTGREVCDTAFGVCGLIIQDCNDNEIHDLCDVDLGTSPDSAPQNGVPDECDARVRFTLTELPTLGGPVGQAFGLNEAGDVVGWSETGDVAPDGRPISHAFAWDGATLTDLGTLGGDNSLAYDVNDVGQIAGWADLAEPLTPPELFGFAENQPTVWNNGVPTQLPLIGEFGYFNGAAYCLNNAGRVGGHSISGFELIQATIWDPTEPRPLEVPPQPGANMNQIWDMAPDGTVVGWMNEIYNGFNRRAFRFGPASSQPEDLGTLGGPWGWALGINDRGDIVGQAAIADGRLRPFLLPSGVPMMDLGSLGGSFALARGVNDIGQVVGASTFPGSSSITDTRAFLWEGGQLEELTDLIPGNTGWLLQDAWDINESERIVGRGINADGFERAFLLTPCGGGAGPCFVSDCSVGIGCDDGRFCNGQEACPAGFCIAGIPPTCSDGDTCTADLCDPGLDACVNPAPPAPPEAGELALALDAVDSTVADLNWDPVGGADFYNVYRAAQDGLADLSCLVSEVQNTFVSDDGALPAVGSLLFYLVTAENCAAESTLGAGTSGAERAAPAPCP